MDVTLEKLPDGVPVKLNRSNVVLSANDEPLPNESDRAPPYATPFTPVMSRPSYCVPRVVPLTSNSDVLKLSVTDATVSTPGLLPGERMPPFTDTAPPVVPEPPRVAPAATVTAPVAADWLPLMSSLPAVTRVAPA